MARTRTRRRRATSRSPSAAFGTEAQSFSCGTIQIESSEGDTPSSPTPGDTPSSDMTIPYIGAVSTDNPRFLLAAGVLGAVVLTR